MEWRIFFPLSDSVPDVWTLLGMGKLSKTFLYSEDRKDIYLSCTERVGLKLRGSKRLMEIKVRGDRHPCGAERWTKVLHKRTNAEGKEAIKHTFVVEIQALLKSSLDPRMLESLQEASSSPWADRHVTIAKMVTKGTFHGVSVEQCDITVSGSLHASPKWRSICFESGSVAKLEEVLGLPVKDSSISVGERLKSMPGSAVQGYPAFIMTVSSHVDQSTAASHKHGNSRVTS